MRRLMMAITVNPKRKGAHMKRLHKHHIVGQIEHKLHRVTMGLWKADRLTLLAIRDGLKASKSPAHRLYTDATCQACFPAS
jgi:hypothetical protein